MKLGTDESFTILNTVFDFCFKECDNPDLRERGYIYWRLMNIDPNLATHIVLGEKSVISQDSSNMDPSLLDKLLDNLGTLAIIYNKPPELFVKKTKRVNIGEEEEYDLEDNNLIDENENQDNNKNFNNKYDMSSSDHDTTLVHVDNFNPQGQDSNVVAQVSSGVNLIDLNDILGVGPSTSNQPINNNLTNLNFMSNNNNNYVDSSNIYNSISIQNDPMSIPNNINNYNMNDNNLYSTNQVYNSNNFGNIFTSNVGGDQSQKLANIPKMVK